MSPASTLAAQLRELAARAAAHPHPIVLAQVLSDGFGAIAGIVEDGIRHVSDLVGAFDAMTPEERADFVRGLHAGMTGAFDTPLTEAEAEALRAAGLAHLVGVAVAGQPEPVPVATAASAQDMTTAGPVEAIARACHEVNRAYCAALGDLSQPAWENAPEWQRRSAVDGVLFHLANPDAGPEASHDSWLRAKSADGWTYGPVKDAAAKQHPCFRPFQELPVEQQAKDWLFRATVHQTMRAIGEAS